jgi:L-lysine 2,3-aminomutase
MARDVQEFFEQSRISTKVPAVLPQRITPTLARMLTQFHSLWPSVHGTHPDELLLRNDEGKTFRYRDGT